MIMNNNKNKKASVMLMVVFIIAMLSMFVSGMLQISTEEMMLANNQLNAQKAVTIAQAGLNDAFAELRNDSSWNMGFTEKPLADGKYTVIIQGSQPNLTVTSTASTDAGFVAETAARITISSQNPHIITIDNYRINE